CGSDRRHARAPDPDRAAGGADRQGHAAVPADGAARGDPGVSRSGAPLFAQPLATFERDGLKATLERDGMPVGFAGIEVHGADALLRSLVTLPPLRLHGVGGAMVDKMETEARARGARAVYLLTSDSADFFAKLGYTPC